MTLWSRERDAVGIRNAISWFAHSLIGGDQGPADSGYSRDRLFLKHPGVAGQAMTAGSLPSKNTGSTGGWEERSQKSSLTLVWRAHDRDRSSTTNYRGTLNGGLLYNLRRYKMQWNTLTRRKLLALTTGGLAASVWTAPLSAQLPSSTDDTVRDRLWLFGSPTGSTAPHTQRRTVMSPAEGAFYLGISNIYMNQANAGAEAKLGRFEPPFEQYAVALRPFKRVLWGLVGSGGFTTPEERKEGLELIRKTPNFVGAHMDDFFTSKASGKRAVLTVDELRELRQTLKGAGRPLEIYATYYTTLLKLPLDDYLKLLDGITFWTWKPEDLVHLASNLAKVKEVAPHLKVILGCYLVDFTRKASIPIPAMQRQCEFGLEALKRNRIAGMMFLSNGVMDLGFEAVEWTRQWIQKVGDTRI